MKKKKKKKMKIKTNKQILDKYDKLRKYEVPILRCGETVVAATDEVPGFLQAAFYLATHAESVKGSKQVTTALKDVNKWINNLRENGCNKIGQIKKWQTIANVLRANK
jgi:hypothetical protein